MEQQPKRRRRRQRRRTLRERMGAPGSAVALLVTGLFELIGYGRELLAARLDTKKLRKQPKRRKRRKRRRQSIRWERVLVIGMALALLLFGLLQLIGYGLDLLAARRSTQELRELYQSAPTDVPEEPEETPEMLFPFDDAPTAVPMAEMPEETPTPAAAPEADLDLPTPSPTKTPIPRLPGTGYPGNPNRKISSRFKTLRKENKDIMGWLNIHRMLDEPVVQRDNVFYLDHDALREENANGALFLDSGISLKNRPYTYVIYGHNMKTGAMFGCLRNYENIDFYRNYPFITFDTMYESGRYVVFAVGNIATEEQYRDYLDLYALRSTSIPERKAGIDTLIATSMHTCTVDVQPDDQLLVLVTCVENDDYRRIVAARRVRTDENESALKTAAEKSRSR
ncbi:MAG: sortase [Clostridia bacterium]|nr:sortase [Clostridia bacterium]